MPTIQKIPPAMSALDGFINQLLRDGSTELLDTYSDIIPSFTSMLTRPDVHLNTYEWADKETLPLETPLSMVRTLIRSNILPLCDIPLSFLVRASNPTSFLTSLRANKTIIRLVTEYYKHIKKFPLNNFLLITEHDIYRGLIFYCDDPKCIKQAVIKIEPTESALGKLLGMRSDFDTIRPAYTAALKKLRMNDSILYSSAIQTATSRGNLAMVKDLVLYSTFNGLDVVNEHILKELYNSFKVCTNSFNIISG